MKSGLIMTRIIQKSQRLLLTATKFLVLLTGIITVNTATAQINNQGCVTGGFGINAHLYSGQSLSTGYIPPAGSIDWFVGPTGRGIINQTSPGTIQTLLQTQNNPSYERRMNAPFQSIAGQVLLPNGNTSYKLLYDAVFARDQFGGSGGIDPTTFRTGSKNGDDPAIWDVGPGNVLGKNDIIDVGGHMFRDVEKTPAGVNVKDNLWFVGMINRAEPGGTAYLDFEFLVEELVTVNGKFLSAGPDLGHTSFKFVPDAGNPGKFKVSSTGDIIFNIALLNGGVEALVETRVWVSRTDWQTKTPSTFNWGGQFDGAFTGSPFGYATITPLGANQICAYVNNTGQFVTAPPWGTRNSKSNVFSNLYNEFSVAEMGINLTELGLDNQSLFAANNPCNFPISTFLVKTRTSGSFTSALKDLAGAYSWGRTEVTINVPSGQMLSCVTPTLTLVPSVIRNDAQYAWSTVNGNIVGPTNTPTIVVDKAGTYHVVLTLPTLCDLVSTNVVIIQDPTKPDFNGTPVVTFTVPCTGSDGTVKATVSGSTGPYTYQLLNSSNTVLTTASNIVSTTHTFTGIAPGSYIVKVTSATGCITTSALITVPAKTALTISSTVTNPTCAGLNNGAINITTTAGKAPFRFAWSNGQTIEDLSNIGAGAYSVNITDGDGCVTNFGFTLTAPSSVTATLTKTDDSNIDPLVGNGAINLSPSGGTAPLGFAWTASQGGVVPPGQQNIEDLTGLRYGLYTVLITDAKGCTFTISAFIYEPEICNDAIDNDGDGQNNCDDTDCTPLPPASITPGKLKPCIGETVSYTAAPSSPVKPGVTYTWTVPANAVIQSGQGTVTIVVIWNTLTPGQVCVRANNVGCLSTSTCYSATITNIPSKPGTINKN